MIESKLTEEPLSRLPLLTMLGNGSLIKPPLLSAGTETGIPNKAAVTLEASISSARESMISDSSLYFSPRIAS